MKNLLIILSFLLPITLSAQLIRSYGVIEIGATFPTSTVTGAKFAYRTVDSSYYRWSHGNVWVKIVEPSIIAGLTMPFDSVTFKSKLTDPVSRELKYSTDHETLMFGAGGTVMEIGQKEAWYVKNQTLSTIPKGTVVMAAGALGASGRILVSPMVSNGTVSAKYLLGIAAADIANGADGYVIHFGKLYKMNTNSWNEGDVLYCSPTTPGALTNVEPAPPNLRLPIAFVVNKHAVNGVLAVRIQTGNELHELHDVDTSGINAGEGLVYNSTSHKWQASTGKLITTVDTAGMLANYPSTAGWGILKSTKTIRADSAKVASRFFVNSNFFPLQGGTLTGTGGAGFVGFPSQITAPGTPASGLNVYAQGSSFNWKGTDGYERQFASTLTGGRTYTLPNASGTFALGTGTATRIPIWTSANALGDSPALYNSTTKRWTWDSPSVLELPMGTDAQRPSPATTSDFWYNMTGGGLEWYNGTRWAKVLESTINIGTVNRIPFFDANGQLTESNTFTQASNKLTLGVPSGKNPMVDIVTGTGDGTVNEAAGLRLRNRDIDGNTFYLQMGTSTSGRGGANQGHAYFQSGLWGGSYNNPLILMPKGGNIAIGATRPINWELSVTSNIAVSAALASASTSNTDGGRIVFNAGTVAGTPYNSAVVSIASVFDKSFWYQGLGLSFRTLSGSDVSGNTTGGTERMRISSDGLIGVGTNSPQRLFHIAGEARITDLTTDTPTRFVGADADGDLGEITVSTGLTLSAGVLTATGASTWLKTELEASRDVTINGGSSTDFRIQNTRVQFDGKTKIGSDSSFVHDPSVDTTIVKGTALFGKQSTLGRQGVSGYPFVFRNASTASTTVLIESGRTSPTGGEAALDFRPSGIWGSTIGYGTTTSKSLQFYNYNNSRAVLFLGSSGFVSGNSRTVIVGGSDDPTQWNGNGGLVVYDTITSGKALFLAKKVSSSSTPIAMFSSASNDRFTFDDNGTTRFHNYGTQTKEASDLSKTFGNIAAFATDGTMLDYRITRDTTVDDVDFTVTSTLLSSCQELVITAQLLGKGSDLTITLPTPSATYKGNKVGIFVVDVALQKIVISGSMYYTTDPTSVTPTVQTSLDTDSFYKGSKGAYYDFVCARNVNGAYYWKLKQ